MSGDHIIPLQKFLRNIWSSTNQLWCLKSMQIFRKKSIMPYSSAQAALPLDWAWSSAPQQILEPFQAFWTATWSYCSSFKFSFHNMVSSSSSLPSTLHLSTGFRINDIKEIDFKQLPETSLILLKLQNIYLKKFGKVVAQKCSALDSCVDFVSFLSFMFCSVSFSKFIFVDYMAIALRNATFRTNDRIILDAQ